jgi:hypothetical protein
VDHRFDMVARRLREAIRDGHARTLCASPRRIVRGAHPADRRLLPDRCRALERSRSANDGNAERTRLEVNG